MKVWLVLDEDDCEALLALIRKAQREASDDRLVAIRCRLRADMTQAWMQEERVAA